MLYLKCPTCSCLLGNIELIYEAEKKRICEYGLSEDEQKKQIRELVNKLAKSYCCKKSIMTYIDVIDFVK